MGKLFLSRDKAFLLKVRKLKIILDGEEIGSIGDSEEVSYSITPGRHTLMVKVDAQYSPTCEFMTEEGGSSRFRCSTAMEGESFLEKLGNTLRIAKRKEKSTLTLVQVY